MDLVAIIAKQEPILQYITDNPGLRFGQITANLQAEATYGDEVPLLESVARETNTIVNALLAKKLIRKEGVSRKFTYHRTDLEYVITADGKIPKESDKIRIDPFLTQNAAFTFTPEQIAVIRKNTHLTRTALAKLLGISKLELNFGLTNKGALGPTVKPAKALHI